MPEKQCSGRRKSEVPRLAEVSPPSAAVKPRTKRVQKKYTERYIQVLEAATMAFSQKGYHVATTKDIADQLNIQQSSLYYYIRSKEAALEAICLLAIEGYVAFSAAIKRSDSSHSRKIRELIDHHLETIRHRPALFKVFMNHRQDLRDEVRREIGCQIRQYERNIESIVRQGIRKREFRSDVDPVLATMGLLGMCNFVSVWWGKRATGDLSAVCDQFASIFIAGLVVEQAAEARSADGAPPL